MIPGAPLKQSDLLGQLSRCCFYASSRAPADEPMDSDYVTIKQ